MSPEQITPALVLGLWAHMAARYGTVTVAKRHSPLMRLAAGALHLGRVLDRRDFMDRFTTVVDRRIYAPFEPGDPEGMPLFAQLDTCVHEHQHVVQVKRDGRARMWSRYLSSPRARALYEAEAYTCGLELQWWVYGRHAEPRIVARTLESYGCSEADIEAAAEVLTENAARVREGVIVTEATRVARAWLELQPAVDGPRGSTG